MQKQEQTVGSGEEVMKWPKVAIVVLNWNGWRHTVECLQSLLALSYPNYHIIVVDNGSTDGSVDRIQTWASSAGVPSSLYAYDDRTGLLSSVAASAVPDGESRGYRLTVIQNSTNFGYAEGNNVALRYCLEEQVPYVLVLNNDLLVDPSMLTELVLAARGLNDRAVVAPLVYDYDDPATVASAGGRINLWVGQARRLRHAPVGGAPGPASCTSVDHVSGCALLVPTSVLEHVGLFDSAFFLTFEDTDFCYRAGKVGIGRYVCHRSKVWHKESASTPGPVGRYFSVRNRALFMKKHGRWYHWLTFPAFYALGSARQVLYLLYRNDRKSALAVIRGVLDGVRLLVHQPPSGPGHPR